MALGPRSEAAAVAVIAVVKAKQAEAIVCEQVQTTRELRQFVNVDQERKNAISQTMRSRPKPSMRDRASVNGGMLHHAASTIWREPRTIRPRSFTMDHGRLTPPSSSATARPA